MNRGHTLGALVAIGLIYLGATGILLFLARIGIVTVADVRETVDVLSSLSTLVVGGLVGLYLGYGPS